MGVDELLKIRSVLLAGTTFVRPACSDHAGAWQPVEVSLQLHIAQFGSPRTIHGIHPRLAGLVLPGSFLGDW